MNQKTISMVLSLAAVLVLGAHCANSARATDEHYGHPRVVDGRGHVLDERYNHGHYYPAVGASVRVLPEGYRPYYYGGRPYYFYGGVWYAPGASVLSRH